MLYVHIYGFSRWVVDRNNDCKSKWYIFFFTKAKRNTDTRALTTDWDQQPVKNLKLDYKVEHFVDTLAVSYQNYMSVGQN